MKKLDIITTNPPLYELDSSDDKTIGARSRSSSKASYTSSSTTASSIYSQTTLVEAVLEEDDSKLPAYTPTLYHRADVWIKNELESPFMRSTIRNWRYGSIEINNTQLKVEYPSKFNMLSRTSIYSLQFAEIGLASDYSKKEFTIRVRAEGKQFLIASDSCESMQSNIVALQMAASLALPLELRQLPEEIKRTRNLERDRERRRLRRKAREQAALERIRLEQLTSSSDSDSDHESLRSSSSSSSNTESIIDTEEKWDPTHRASKFSEKDFPHLIFNSSWEGKSFLLGGKMWAVVHKQKILLMPSRIQA